MKVVYMQLFGCGICVFSSLALGSMLKRHPSKRIAEKTTIFAHAIIIFFWAVPLLDVLRRAGFVGYDQLLGIPLLPFQSSLKLAGIILILFGIFFIIISTSSLFEHGKGLPGFILSQELASVNIYAYTRNPMSLGGYLILISIGFLSGSTFFTLWSLIIIIPTHVCYLKFFEEIELEMRFGQNYIEFRNRVPFFIPNFGTVYRGWKKSSM